jgi:hypothetical protein
LTRCAVAQDVLEFIEQRRIKHRDLRAFLHVALPGLQQPRDVSAGKTFAASAREIVAEVEPLLAAGDDLHARRHALDVAGDVLKSFAHRHAPLALETRQVRREKAEDAPLASQDEFALCVRPVEAARF